MAFADSVSRVDEACLRVFGREITYLREAGGQTLVHAVFQPAREAEDASPGVYAVLFVRAADLPTAPVRGDEVEIGGIRYKVFDIEADAEGAAVLRLRKTA
ncbi:MAG TPA: hypothetical protein VE999_02335 [Gemmataceae bacterium]|jgi:hypothetical protein|nr:hypothetical protein [Gemmataceae bacterium]